MSSLILVVNNTFYLFFTTKTLYFSRILNTTKCNTKQIIIKFCIHKLLIKFNDDFCHSCKIHYVYYVIYYTLKIMQILFKIFQMKSLNYFTGFLNSSKKSPTKIYKPNRRQTFFPNNNFLYMKNSVIRKLKLSSDVADSFSLTVESLKSADHNEVDSRKSWAYWKSHCGCWCFYRNYNCKKFKKG